MAKNAFGDEIIEPGTAPGFLAPASDLLPARRPVGPKEARDMADAILSGFQSSATGLGLRRELPTLALPENAPWYHRLGANAAGVLADLPLSIVAAVPGMAAGTAVGGPGLGTVVGAGAAAFAAPMGVREALMTAYAQDQARSWSDLWEIAKAGATGATKGAVIGGATLGAGRVVAPLVAGSGVAARVGAPLAAELMALTGTAAALEGRIPTAQEVLDNAILLWGMKGAVAGAGKLRQIFAETGKHPAEVVRDALKDPALKAEILEQQPRIGLTDAEMQTLAADLPPVRPGHTRLFRGEDSGVPTGGAWATPDVLEAAYYARSSIATAENVGRVMYQDVPNTGFHKGATGDLRVESQFMASWKPLKDPAPLDAAYLTALRQKIEAAEVNVRRVAQGEREQLPGAERALRDAKTEYDAALTAKSRVYVADADALAAARKNMEATETAVAEAVKRDAPYSEILGLRKAARNAGREYNKVLDAEPYLPNATIDQRVQAALGADPRPELMRGAMVDLIKGEPKSFDTLLAETSPIKMEYLMSQADLQAFARTIEPFVRGEIEIATRGEVPARRTIAEGVVKAVAGLEPHEVGAGVSPSTMAARAITFRMALTHAAKELRENAEKPEIERGTVDNLKVYASLERAYTAYTNLRGAAAEPARALNILWQLKYRPDLMGEAKGLEALFAVAHKRDGLTFGNIAALAASLRDPAQLARFAELWTQKKLGFWEIPLEVWKASILSGLITFGRNIAGNVGKAFVEIPETALTVSIEALRRASKGDTMSLAEYKAKAFAPIHGWILGTRDALVVAHEALIGEGQHLGKAELFRTATPGKIGYHVRWPFRLLQMMDVFFRIPAERGQAYAMAVERAIKEGFRPETREYAERVINYTMRPEAGLDAAAAGKVLATIDQVGREAVFTQRLGPSFEKAQLAFAGTPMGFIIPFWRTPINLLSWAVRHTPGVNLLSARWRADWAAGGVARDRAIAQVMMGAGLSMLAYTLFKDGILTGGGHFDPEERKAKMGAGWQRYSIRNPFTGTYYSYEGLEPVGKVIGLVADLMEMKRENPEDGAKVAMASIALFGNATISTTYLSGIAGVFNAATDPARYWESFYEQYAASLVPKIAGQTAAIIDPHFREVNGALDAIQSQIPFLREKLLPQRNLWGEERKNFRLFDTIPNVTPFRISRESQDKVKTEAVRLGLALAPVPKFMYEPGPTRPKDRQIKFTPEQYDVAQQATGTWAMSVLAPYVNHPDWERMADLERAAVYQSVFEAARAFGKEKALPATAPEREAMRQKIQNEINKQFPTR